MMMIRTMMITTIMMIITAKLTMTIAMMAWQWLTVMIIFMMTLMMAMIILTVIGIMIPPCDSTCVELSALHSLHCLFPGVGGGGKSDKDGGVFFVLYTRWGQWSYIFWSNMDIANGGDENDGGYAWGRRSHSRWVRCHRQHQRCGRREIWWLVILIWVLRLTKIEKYWQILAKF